MIKGVPYDAEIEYLESTGTQYIDIGVVINCVTDVVDCRVTVTSVKSYGTAFGMYESIDSGGKFFGVRRNGNQDSWQALWGTLSHSLYLDTFYDIHYEHGADKCYINDTTGTSGANVEYTKPLYVCALNGPNGAQNYNAQRLYSFSIRRNGIFIRDLIPVRKGNIGYMYDRVTRKLFGNAGTGGFVLGPDKSYPVMSLHFYPKPKPIAKDYIQNGLVAMWDGIENAGWGTHDASGTCQNLVGEGVFTGTASDNSFILSKVSIVNNIDTSSNMTIEWLYPVSGADRNVRFATQLIGQNVNRYQVDDVRAGYEKYQIRYRKNGTQVSVYPMSKTVRRGGISFESGMFKVYADGVEIASYEADAATDSNVLLVGASFNFNNLRVYSRALTAEEVAHNYEIDKERFNLE